MTCRVCHEKFDIANKKIDVDYVMPSRNWYYHASCYNNWKRNSVSNNDATDEEWKGYIYDFLARDLKIEYDYFKVEAQIKKFLKKKMTMKGIFFSLKYFYGVRKGDKDKGHGGIGIVEYIYADAVKYWVEQENRSKGVCAKIQEQMAKAQQAESNKISHNSPKKKKKKRNLLERIEEMEC